MLLIISIIAALAIFFITADASWGNVLSHARNDLVFNGRVQDYGAYALRKEQPRTMLYAVLLTCGLVGTLFGLSKLQKEPVKVKVPFVSTPDWLDIEPMEIEQKQETQTKAKVSITKPNSAPPASSGQINDGEIEVVEERTEPPVLITDPGQGGDDKTKNSQPGGEPAGIGTGDGDTGKTGTGSTEFVIPDYAQVMPEYPGGQEAMMKYMLSKVKFSEWDKERGVSGTMYIQFVVNTDGSITDIKLARKIKGGEQLAEKAIQAISKMPKWSPGKNGQISVPVRYTMPLTFTLRN